MLYSKTAEYAVRALAVMAIQSPKNSQSVSNLKRISKISKISPSYLAKIFQVLVKSGLIESIHGRRGGFRLRKNPKEIKIMDIILVIDAIDKTALKNCVMGMEECNSKNPCPLHFIWEKCAKKIKRELKSKSLVDIIPNLSGFSSNKKEKTLLSTNMKSIF